MKFGRNREGEGKERQRRGERGKSLGRRRGKPPHPKSFQGLVRVNKFNSLR